MDYVGGKAAWFSAGLPGEGSLADGRRVGGLVTSGLLDLTVASVARGATVADARASGAEVVVVTVDGVVDGLLVAAEAAEAADEDDGVGVVSVMDAAPATVRPSLPTSDLLDRIREGGGGGHTLVTTAQGALVGVVAHDELRALARADRLP